MTTRNTSRRGLRIIPGLDKQTLTAQEMQQREIMRITRLLVRLERERRSLKKRLKIILKIITSELRLLRRAQRIVLAPSFQPEDLDSAKRDGGDQ